MFDNKTLLITGGTGSFGNKLLEMFLNSNLKEIRIFSRDEKKQDDMRKKYNHPKIKYYIGDVRDKSSLEVAMTDVDYVFHASALKQVPSCECFPIEAVKTNILGSNNVMEMAIKHKVKKIIFLSTDKATYPINAMGMSKALMEKTVIARARNESDTIMCLTRYGNVMGSRGSVIPLFYKQIEEGKPLTITNPDMTRYMMTLKEAVDLVMYAFEKGNQGDLFVQKSPATTIDILAKAIMKFKGCDVKPKIIGVRVGEKDHEVLVTKEEMAKAIDLGNYYKIPMDAEGYEDKEEYTSKNTRQLNVDEMIELLKEMGEVEY